MRSWKEEFLVDNLESLIDYRGKTPKKSIEGILTLSAKSVKMGEIDYSQAYHISKETYKKFMTRGFPKKGDILMTTEAPLGCIAKLDRDDISVAQRLLTLRGKRNILSNDYLMYYLMSRRGQHELLSRASGSTVQGIKRSEFERVKILLPPYGEQAQIAKTLSVLDDKITLLRQQNETLEGLAQLLFKRWFVEEANEDWEIGLLSDLIEIKYGKDHKKIDDGEIPIYGSGGIMRHGNKALREQESVLIPRKGSLNNVVYIDEPFWTVDTMFYTEMKQPNIAKFVYQFIKRKDLLSMNVGSAVPSMTTEVLNNIPIRIPPDSDFEKYENTVSPFYKTMKSNNIQIQTLTKLRDTLLPKLMSGEVRLKN